MAEGGVGRELKRMSSFELLIVNSSAALLENDISILSDDELEKLIIIQSWWTKRIKLLKAKRNLLKAKDQAETLIQTIKKFKSRYENNIIQGEEEENDDSLTFEEGQRLISSPSLIKALSFFLSCLPKDPSVNLKEVPFARVIISSVMIWRFPNDLLTSSNPIENNRMKTKTRAKMRSSESESDVSESDNDDEKKNENNINDEYEKDDSVEAMACFATANFLIRGLIRLLNYAVTGGNMRSFHQILLTFRYESRIFISALEKWKALDSTRMLQGLELVYMQSYAMVLAAREKAAETGNNERDLCLVKAAENQLDKVHRSLLQVVGDVVHGNHIAEELRAQVEAAFTNKSSIINIDNSTSVKEAVHIPVIDFSDKIDNETEFQQIKLLDRISTIAGLGNEKLAHELYFNPSFHLPEIKLPTFEMMLKEDDSNKSNDLHEKMKRQLLRLIGDRMIWSLKPSTIVSSNDILEGDIIPVKYELWGSSSYLSAKVLNINISGDKKTLDVQYIYDEVTESNVDVGRIKLVTSTHNPSPLVTAIIELKDRIQSLMPRRSDLQVADFSRLDLDLLSQMIIHNAITTDDLLNYLLPLLLTIKSLGASVRSEFTGIWLESFVHKCRSTNISEVFSYLPFFFEFCSACIDEVLRDMANYYIATLVPVMQKEAPSFLRKKFIKQLSEGKLSLTNTYASLRNIASNFETLRVDIDEALGTQQETKFSLPLTINIKNEMKLTLSGRSIVAKYFLQTLQTSNRLDSIEGLSTLPETLGWDASRLSKFRDDIDIIALELTIAIVLKQTIARYSITLSEEDEIEFQTRLDVILREPDVKTQFIITESFRIAKNGAEKMKGKTINFIELEENIAKALKNVINLENPVILLFSKRIYKVILKAILKQPYLASLKQFSLNGKIQEKNLGNIMKAIVIYFDKHINIHEKIYAALLNDDDLLKLF